VCTCDLPVHHPCLNSRGVSVVREVQLWHCMDSICGVCMDSSCGVCMDSNCGVCMDSNCGVCMDNSCGVCMDSNCGVCMDSNCGVCMDNSCGVCMDSSCGVCVDSSCGVWMDSNCGSGFVFQDCGKLKGGRLSVCVNGRQGVICVLRPCVLMADKAWFVC